MGPLPHFDPMNQGFLLEFIPHEILVQIGENTEKVHKLETGKANYGLPF